MEQLFKSIAIFYLALERDILQPHLELAQDNPDPSNLHGA